MHQIIDFFIHLDEHLQSLIGEHHGWIYLILFVIVFCETGLVVTPFLPGDSLLFAAGLLAHPDRNALNVWLLLLIFPTAALLGDNVNYFIGKTVGPKIFRSDKARFFKRSHLNKTHEFYERYGGKTIIIARFVPIVRTFAPFVAGIGAMTYPKYIIYCIAGALIWVNVCVWAGYFFGNLEFVKNNFSYAILAIILISLTPPFIEFILHKRREKKKQVPLTSGTDVDA